MDEDELRKLEEASGNNHSALILYRLARIEIQLDRNLNDSHANNLEVFRRIRSLENWRIYMLGAGAVISLIIYGCWEWFIQHHP